LSRPGERRDGFDLDSLFGAAYALQPLPEKSTAVQRSESIGSDGDPWKEEKNLQNFAVRLLTSEAI
jgi:hypothetical protein